MYLVNRQFKKCYDFYSMFATFFLILKAKTRFNVFIFTQSFITFTTLKATTANKLLSQCQQFVQIRVVIWWICMDYWSRTMFGVSEWDRKPSGKKEWRRTGERQTDRERERERERERSGRNCQTATAEARWSVICRTITTPTNSCSAAAYVQTWLNRRHDDDDRSSTIW